ncbi:MAG: PAS domain S-box protein [Anaerolineae bacterium]|nr:PAS domain S-box protein [Anaerolineae bacterium]
MASPEDRQRGGAMLELAQAMLDACETATAAWAMTGTILAHNRAFAELLGSEATELRGHLLHEVVGAAEAEKLLLGGDAARQEAARDVAIDLGVERSYGLQVEVKAVAASPDEWLLAGTFRPVARPGLDRVREALDDAVFALDRRGRVTYWSQGAETLYGVAAPETLGRRLEAVLPNHPLAGEQPVADQVSGTSVAVIERAGYPRLSISRRSAPLLELDGTVTGVLDMAGEATVGRTLPTPPERADDAIMRSRDLVVMVDRQYRVTLANAAYLHTHRRTPETLEGRPAAEVVGEEVFASALKPRLDSCFAGSETHFEMYRHYEHLGRRHLLVSYFPIRDSSGEVISAAGVIRDSTSQHALAQQRDAAVRLLDVISASVSVDELAERTLDLLAELTECETVGLRLRPGLGYRPLHHRHDRHSASGDGGGDVDPLGRAPLDVLCALLPAGREEHEHGRLLYRGAFLSGSLLEWASAVSSTEVEPFLQQCVSDGYRTLGLLPLVRGPALLGVLYLADPQPDLIGRNSVQFLEELAVSLAVGVERLSTEAALRASEERYRSFVREFSGIAYRGDMDFVPEFFHGAVEAITGYTEAEFLAGSPRWDQVIHPEDLGDVLASVATLISEPGVSAERTYRIVRRDGAVRWVQEYITGVRDPATGRTHRVHGTIYDVTERLEASQEIARLAADLAQERDLLRTLMENTQAQLAFLDRDLRFVLVNSAYEAGCGHSFEELSGQYHFDVFPNDENRAIFEAVRDTGRPASHTAKPFAFAHDPGRGTTYWDWTLTPITGDRGDVTGLVLSLVDVTEAVLGRRRVEELAQQARRHAVELEATVQAIADGMIVYGPSGEIVSINEAARSILGYGEEDQGLPVTDRIRGLEPTADDGRRLSPEQTAPIRALRGETVRSASMSISPPYGPGRVWLSLSAAPIRDTDGRLLGAVMTMSDVTPLREAQAGLERANAELMAQKDELVRQSERLRSLAGELEAERARLHAIIESAPEGIMVVDEQARAILANPAAARIYSDLSLTGTPRATLPQLLRPDGVPYSAGDRPIVVSALDGKTLRAVPGYVVSPEGERRDLLINSAPIVNADGRRVGAVSVLQDVTEMRRHERQRQELMERVQLSEEETRRANELLQQEVADRIEAERQVRESRVLLERSFAALRDAIFVVDVNDVILHCNPAAEEQFGYRREELIGRPMLMLHVDQASYHRLMLEREAAASRRGFVSLEQYPMRRRDGTSFPTERLEAPLEDEAGAVLGRVTSVRDISERLKLERMKAEFVGSVSHELRSPLASIMGYTEIVVDEGAGPLTDLQREFLITVQESSRRLEWLINDLLDASRMETGRYTLDLNSVDPGALLQSAADNARPLATEHRVSLTVDLPDRLPNLEADGRRLRQVVDNLLGNALKFTPAGGHVSVRSWARSTELVIEVSDDGIGIPEEERERVFERFYRAGNAAHEAAGGTGLGLYIARGIVEAHGGAIEVESAVGEGSTFRVRLPLRTSGDEDAGTARA